MLNTYQLRLEYKNKYRLKVLLFFGHPVSTALHNYFLQVYFDALYVEGHNIVSFLLITQLCFTIEKCKNLHNIWFDRYDQYACEVFKRAYCTIVNLQIQMLQCFSFKSMFPSLSHIRNRFSLWQLHRQTVMNRLKAHGIEADSRTGESYSGDVIVT